jgi:hypothetical protein
MGDMLSLSTAWLRTDFPCDDPSKNKIVQVKIKASTIIHQ